MYIYHIDEDPTSLTGTMAADLQWTTTPPKDYGLYRAKRKSGGVEWVLVGNSSWIATFFGNMVKEDEFTHWLGPLPIPEPPTESE